MVSLPSSPPTLRERVGIVKACQTSQAARDEALRRSKQDVAWFVNAFCFTFDPRKKGDEPRDIPFILYDYQVETLHWLDRRYQNDEDGFIEKSRDMGATWVIMAWIIHKWLFDDGFQALVGSSKEDNVDNFTIRSHFGKLEYLLRKLPGWMLPEGFTLDKNRKKLRLENPATGALIEGESSNPNFGRQGRYSIVYMDEGAFWPDLSQSWRAAGETTRCRIICTTPNGQNYFYQLKETGQYKVLTLHWTLHPEKDEEWYEWQKSRMTAEDLAQEVDLSYSRSQRGRVYPGWDEIPSGRYELERGYVPYVSWDFGISDDTALIWFGWNHTTDKIRIIDCYSNHGKPITFYVPFVLGYIPDDIDEGQYTPEEVSKIHSKANWQAPINFGDPAGNQRSQTTGTSVIEELARYGIHVVVNDKARGFKERKWRTELGLKRVEGWNSPECLPLNAAIRAASFPERNPDTKTTSESVLPIHNWTSHFRSALEYFFVNVPVKGLRRRPKPKRKAMAYDNL